MFNKLSMSLAISGIMLVNTSANSGLARSGLGERVIQSCILSYGTLTSAYFFRDQLPLYHLTDMNCSGLSLSLLSLATASICLPMLCRHWSMQRPRSRSEQRCLSLNMSSRSLRSVNGTNLSWALTFLQLMSAWLMGPGMIMCAACDYIHAIL